MSNQFLVNRYLNEGRIILPVLRGEKATRLKNWSDPNLKPTAELFEPNHNLAERLDGRVDIDADCAEARFIAPRLLLQTNRVHGRPSLGPSHWWFITPSDALTKCEQFKDPEGKVLIEIRTGNGHYTLLPPSEVMTKDADPKPENLLWSKDGVEGKVNGKGLRERVIYIASASLLARYWPAGGKHNTTLAFAGMMFKLGVQPDMVEAMLRAVTAYRHPEDGSDGWSEIPATVRATYESYKADTPHTGAVEFAKLIDSGDKIVDLIRGWFEGPSQGKKKGKTKKLSDADLLLIVKEMNERHFYTRIGKDTVVGSENVDGVVFQIERALYSWYANQKVLVSVSAWGEEQHRSRFELWREHPKRRQYRTVTFAPPPRVALPDEYNLWSGLAIEPSPGDCSRFLAHLHQTICGGNDEHFAYLLDVLAFTVKHPGIPSEIAVVMKGQQGTGKGIFVRNFGRIFGRHYVQLDRSEHVTGKFNASISGKVIVFADEAFFAGDKRQLGSLKRIITEPTLQIERKGIDAGTEPNCMHLFMATNEDWSVPAGFNERRFFIVNVSDAHLQDHAHFTAIQKELDNGGLQAFLGFLLERGVTHERIRQVPRTDELRVQQEHTMPSEMKWWKECLTLGKIQEQDWPDVVLGTDLHRSYLGWCDDMKVQRPVSLVDLTRRILKPWLGELKRVDNRPNTKGRVLLPLADARALFDKTAGTVTPWDEESEPEDRQPSAEGMPFGQPEEDL